MYETYGLPFEVTRDINGKYNVVLHTLDFFIDEGVLFENIQSVIDKQKEEFMKLKEVYQ